MAVVPIVTPVKFPPELTDFEGWTETKRILVILAHPDDPEFFCGATLARWAANGHTIHYCLLTCGDKGAPNGEIQPAELCSERLVEQKAAAAVIGAKNVRFLGFPDGYLIPSLDVRREVVRVIREEKPDLLMTCDPTMLYFSGNRLNHPDHRSCLVDEATRAVHRDAFHEPGAADETCGSHPRTSHVPGDRRNHKTSC